MGREHDAAAIRAAAHELTGAAGDFDALIDRVGDAGCVLLGESTHGTAEFYAVRAHITQRLVEEKGFGAVAVEADWPAAAAPTAGRAAHRRTPTPRPRSPASPASRAGRGAATRSSRSCNGCASTTLNVVPTSGSTASTSTRGPPPATGWMRRSSPSSAPA